MAMKDITDLQVVQAQQRWRDNRNGPFGYEILAAETGQADKVCYRCLERAAARGLLDYGVSLRTAWLTESGMALLASSVEELPIDSYPIESICLFACERCGSTADVKDCKRAWWNLPRQIEPTALCVNCRRKAGRRMVIFVPPNTTQASE